MILFKDLLNAEYVAFLKCERKEDCLNALIDVMAQSPNIKDVTELRKAVFDRESIMSTGIGLGIAIPHVKIPSVKDISVCIGIHREGVDWEALDGEPVHIIFLIAGSEDQHSIYLQTVSKIVLVLKNAKRREQLIEAGSVDDVLALFRSV